ncbi:unnamed protein product [Paramecium primaurelia]|uniref:Uncharacterized protein n=1 Tax=Paramecium primaurelia TaxID=5886 RepID=A0A8S1KZA9_PARPR|nr:unnamed protein product [Paramecium primaurelia]
MSLYQQCNKFGIEQMAHIANSRNQVQLRNLIDFERIKNYWNLNSILFIYKMIYGCPINQQKIMHQNALLQESVKSQIDHKVIDLDFQCKYCRQIKYIILLENIPLKSINLFRISILLLKLIVLQENEQYLNLINVILALHLGRIINLIIIVTLKLIQQVIFPNSLKYNLLIKNLKQLQHPTIVQ